MEQITTVQNKIYEVRGHKVMLDRDLAELYGVETKRINEAVKRNIERFIGDDFMFELTIDECVTFDISLRSQIATLNEAPQKGRRGQHVKYHPYAFTEMGVAMLSSVLRSQTAIEINRGIMRAFVQIRTSLATPQPPQLLADLATKLETMEQRLAQIEQQQAQKLLPPPPLPEYLSDEVLIIEYSEKSYAICSDNPDDRRLLRALGGRFNNWLKWQGQSFAGWIFPRSHSNRLFIHMHPRKEDGWKPQFGKSKKL